jgi:hypothetical protein
VNKDTSEHVAQSMHRAATAEELVQDVEIKGINEDGTIFKGIYAILREGGDSCKAENGTALVKECSKARKHLLGCAPGGSCQKNARCCLQNCLRWRPDFANQKCKLQQVCEAAGVHFLMLPKCHPECNPIERFWNYTKRHCRQWCDYTVAGLNRVLPSAFLSVPMHWVRKSFERCDRYLEIYDMEKCAMPFGIREYVVKKYKSHRLVSTTIDELLDRTFDDLQEKKVDLQRRREQAGIKHEKLQKVNDLLKQLERAVECIPAIDMDISLRRLQGKIDNVAWTEENKAVEMINMARFHRNLIKTGQLGRQGSSLYHTWMRENQTLSHPTGLPTVVIARRKRPKGTRTGDDVQITLAALSSDATDSNSDTHDVEVRLQHGESASQNCDKEVEIINWVQCEMCAKWRKVPPGVDANSLPRNWNCDVGGKLHFGLNCNVAEESTYEGDALPAMDEMDDCHQPLTGGYRVKRASVLLHSHEEITLRSEWGLRPCYTWGDGYCGFRCAAANRGTTMQQMLHDLYGFWEWKWAKKLDEGQLTFRKIGAYKYAYPHKPDWNYETQYDDELAQKKIAELRPVEQALTNGYEKLHRRHWCPEDIFEALAAIDNMCILFIKSMSQPGEPPYKVYLPKVCVLVNRMEDLTCELVKAKEEGLKVRGVALGSGHFCALYPQSMQPNFAGNNAIGPFQ